VKKWRSQIEFKGKLSAILLLVCGYMISYAQISPGDLTRAHAKLEGMTNCTKCHSLGDKVTNDKCLECHKEIKNRITENRGYHVSPEVKGKDCFSCHSEHHGRNFEIVRFDSKNFNHQKTGYRLTGAHLNQDCAACHKDERIESADIRNKEYTYLGLRDNCISCHEDVHQNTLSTDCKTCHNTDSFQPAPFFDHNKSRFPLKGKHKEQECSSCHEITTMNGANFQQFKGIQFNSCANCHTDPHNGSLGNKCKECHTEESFSVFSGKSYFNHSQTQFPLIGSHKKVDCASCHKMGNQVESNYVFQDYKSKDFHQCITCHQDVHDTKFGTDCKQCHTEESFRKIMSPDKFQHGLTGYPLEGKHEEVDCRKCHMSKTTDPVPHALCGDCHEDFHNGQLTSPDQRRDCQECHTVTGFAETQYSIAQHQTSVFPLAGAHQATPCFACHLKEEQWTFRNIGTQCNDCHLDVHEEGLSQKYYPGKSCERCHVPDTWSAVTFDHLETGVELTGKHKTIQCTSCHQSDEKINTQKKVFFTGLTTECISCHADQHNRQFEKEGITTCSDCHNTDQWKPSIFDHNTARFKLDGAHINVECQKCHKEEIIDDQKVIRYRLERFACADCHS